MTDFQQAATLRAKVLMHSTACAGLHGLHGSHHVALPWRNMHTMVCMGEMNRQSCASHSARRRGSCASRSPCSRNSKSRGVGSSSVTAVRDSDATEQQAAPNTESTAPTQGHTQQTPDVLVLPASYLSCTAGAPAGQVGLIGAGWSCDEELEGRTLEQVKRLEQARLSRCVRSC